MFILAALQNLAESGKETVADRLVRLAPSATPSDGRLESLRLAAEAGVSDELFVLLAEATKLFRGPKATLPAHRFEGLSRGRGWCRKGKGTNAEWGSRGDHGYTVGAGRWVVGGSDGFSRKKEDIWDVVHVQVGDKTWTIAN